jgi:hypothetical protein
MVRVGPAHRARRRDDGRGRRSQATTAGTEAVAAHPLFARASRFSRTSRMARGRRAPGCRSRALPRPFPDVFAFQFRLLPAAGVCLASWWVCLSRPLAGGDLAAVRVRPPAPRCCRRPCGAIAATAGPAHAQIWRASQTHDPAPGDVTLLFRSCAAVPAVEVAAHYLVLALGIPTPAQRALGSRSARESGPRARARNPSALPVQPA